jgi:hypothetical protein
MEVWGVRSSVEREAKEWDPARNKRITWRTLWGTKVWGVRSSPEQGAEELDQPENKEAQVGTLRGKEAQVEDPPQNEGLRWEILQTFTKREPEEGDPPWNEKLRS